MTVRIGAEISGADLTKPLLGETIATLQAAIAGHPVIFFRDQSVSREDHLRLGRAFGELAIHTGVSGLADDPAIVAIHADGNSKVVTGGNRHSDLPCNAEPPMGSILALHTVPEVGGDI